MKILQILDSVPRIVLVLALPAAAFSLAIGLALGTGGSDQNATSPSLNVAVSQAQALPTSVPAPATPTTGPNRADCKAINGTTYESDAERAWFEQNCNGSTQITSTTAAATTGGTGTGTSTSAGATTSPTGSEYALGDHLTIPSISVDADVYGMKVSGDGTMPNPTGYFEAVWYDFSALGSGYGGYLNSGNIVLAGHVDCAACHNGSPGVAVFYYMRSIQVGATIQYTHNGQVYNYVVTNVADYDDSANWAGLVSSSAADMTLITCNGVFDPSVHAYNLRRVVYARKA